MTRRTGHLRAGFTLIEILVVIAIIGIMTAFVVPRLTGTTKRTFELAVDQVADLLVMYAQRDQLSRRPIGLSLDPDRREIALLVLDNDPDDPDAPPRWRRDVLIAPVELPDIIDFDEILVFADGDPTDIRGWPLTNTPGEPRPTIEVLLGTIDDEYDATLRLTPHAVVPERIGHLYIPTRDPVDLDSIGLAQEDW